MLKLCIVQVVSGKLAVKQEIDMSLKKVELRMELDLIFGNPDRCELRVTGLMDYGEQLLVKIGERSLKDQVERFFVESGDFLDLIQKIAQDQKEDA